MAETLFPVVSLPELISDSTEYDNKYKPSVQWDHDKGDFYVGSSGHLEESTGIETFKTWCCKVAMTERYRCLAYPSEIGVEMVDALDELDEKAVESAVERTITEALSVNPRTEYVRDFVFSHNGDKLECQFRVKGINADEFLVSI